VTKFFELSKRGEKVLKNRGFGLPPERSGDERLFEHSMMVNDVMAALAIGMLPARIVWWDELCRRRMPFLWMKYRILSVRRRGGAH
jgi:hypothetical protein